jgi:hypothetical protein
MSLHLSWVRTSQILSPSSSNNWCGMVIWVKYWNYLFGDLVLWALSALSFYKPPIKIKIIIGKLTIPWKSMGIKLLYYSCSQVQEYSSMKNEHSFTSWAIVISMLWRLSRRFWRQVYPACFNSLKQLSNFHFHLPGE